MAKEKSRKTKKSASKPRKVAKPSIRAVKPSPRSPKVAKAARNDGDTARTADEIAARVRQRLATRKAAASQPSKASAALDTPAAPDLPIRPHDPGSAPAAPERLSADAQPLPQAAQKRNFLEGQLYALRSENEQMRQFQRDFLASYEDKLRQREEEFGEALSRKDSEIEVLTGRFLELQKDKTALENEQLSRDAHISRLKRQEKELLEEVEHVRMQAAEFRDQVKITETKLKDRGREIQEFDQVKKRNAENLEWLEHSLTERDRTIEGLEDRLKQKQGEIEQHKADLAQRNRRTEQFLAELDSLKERNEELLVRLDQKNSDMDDLRAELEQLARRLQEEETGRNQAEALVQQSLAMKDDLASALEQKESNLAQLLEDLEIQARKSQDLEQELDRNQGEITQNRAQLSQAGQRIERASKTIRVLEQAKGDLQARLASLMEEAREAGKRTQALEAGLKEQEESRRKLAFLEEQAAREKADLANQLEERDKMLIEMDQVLFALNEQAARARTAPPIPGDEDAAHAKAWWAGNVPARVDEPPLQSLKHMRLGQSLLISGAGFVLLFGLSRLLPSLSGPLFQGTGPSPAPGPPTPIAAQPLRTPAQEPAPKPTPLPEYKYFWDRLGRKAVAGDLAFTVVLKSKDEMRSKIRLQAGRMGSDARGLAQLEESELGRYDFDRFYYLEFYVRTLDPGQAIDPQKLYSNISVLASSDQRLRCIAPAPGFKPRIVDTPSRPGTPRRIMSLSFTAVAERQGLPSRTGTFAVELLDPKVRIDWEDIAGLL